MARHSLEGLIKWAQREDWRDELQWALDQHLGTACEELGVNPEELPELLEDGHLRNLWGCAFEDLVTREVDGRNIADEYLKRRKWKESAETCAYVKALRQSVMSLYEVSDVRRDKGLFARDLIRGGEPIWINEKSGTHYLAQWDRIAARIISVRGQMQMAGGLLSFERDLSDELIDAIKQIVSMSPEKLANAIGELAKEGVEEDDDETREVIAALKTQPGDMTVDAMLAASAFVFTTYWLRNVLKNVLDPQLPQLFNSGGEPIEWIEIRYPIVGADSQAKLIRALMDVPALIRDGRSTWSWIETEPGGGKTRRQDIPEKGMTLKTEREDGENILGTIECKRRTLILSVNSREREARGRALIESMAGKFLGSPTIERRSTEELLADKKDDGNGKSRTEGIEQFTVNSQAIMRRYFDDYYARVLDEPVPMLGNVTPRAAAGSHNGRAKVVAWLKGLENDLARQAQRDPALQYDCKWMWRELDLDAYRQ